MPTPPAGHLRLKQLSVLGISLTIAPLIVIPEVVWQSFTVEVSALELVGYPTMVFSGFLCAVDSAYGCAWFAITQQIYNALAIKLTTGRWVVVLAWLSYALNTCVTCYMAVCAVRARWERAPPESAPLPPAAKPRDAAPAKPPDAPPVADRASGWDPIVMGAPLPDDTQTTVPSVT